VVIFGVYYALELANRVFGSLPERCASVEISTYAEPMIDAIVIFGIEVTSAAIVVLVEACYVIALLCGRDG
jgi:hypothetical protein